MNKNFTLKDLQTGDIVETRGGEPGIVIADKEAVIYQKNGLDYYDAFTDDLVSKDELRKYDIVKVYRGSKNSAISFFDYKDGDPIYIRTETATANQNNRTIEALVDILKGKVWVFLKDEETCRQFYEDAEAEGFRFGTILPTQSGHDDIIALHHCKQLGHVGFVGHMAFHVRKPDPDFHRINYAKYIAGMEDFYFKPEDWEREPQPEPDYN